MDGSGGSGASHGGTGGRGTTVSYSNPAYGSVTHPTEYGSGGSVSDDTSVTQVNISLRCLIF